MTHVSQVLVAVLIGAALIAAAPLLRRFHPLLRAAGATPGIAQADGDIGRASIAGALVIGTTVIGTLAMYAAINIAAADWPLVAKIGAALAWGFVLFNIDRWLVNHLAARWLSRITGGVIRIGLSLVIGYFVASMVILTVLGAEIQDKLNVEHSADISTRTQQARTTSPPAQDIAQKTKDISAQQLKMSNAASAVTTAEKAWDGEFYGTSGTGVPGSGTHEQQRHNDLVNAQTSQTSIDSAAQTAIATDTAAIATDNQQISVLVTNIQQSVAADNGILARKHALAQVLKDDSDATSIYNGILGLLIAIDVTPAVFSLLAKPTAEQARQAEEDDRRAADRKIQGEATRTPEYRALVNENVNTRRERANQDDLARDDDRRQQEQEREETARLKRDQKELVVRERARADAAFRMRHPFLTRPAFLAGPVAAVAAVALLLTSGVIPSSSAHTGTSASSNSTKAGTASPPAAQTTAGPVNMQPVTVPVSPVKPISLTVPGVGTLTGTVGTVTTDGTMTVQPSGTLRAGSMLPSLTQAGPGVNVSFAHTKLTKQLTVTYDASAMPAGSIPVVAHHGHDGTWNMLPASYSGNAVTVSTGNFSPTWPAWLTPSGWASWVEGRLSASLFGTSSAWACDNTGPNWLEVQKDSNLISVCGQWSSDHTKGEVRIKNTSPTALEVTLNGPISYAWVQNQGATLRSILYTAVGAGGGDPQRTVFLPAATQMSVGYAQPEGNMDIDIEASPTARAAMTQLSFAVIDAAVGDMAGLQPVYAVAGYALQQCAGVVDFSQPRFFTGPDGVGQFALCMLQHAPDIVGKALDGITADDEDITAALNTAKDAASKVSLALLARPFVQQLGGLLDNAIANGLDTDGKVNPKQAVSVFLTGTSQPTTQIPVGVSNGGTTYNPQGGNANPQGGTTNPQGGTPVQAPTTSSTSTTANPRLKIVGTCTTDGGTLTGQSSGFTKGGTDTISATHPDGSPYEGLATHGHVHDDGSITWSWPCKGDAAGTYTTTVVDDSSQLSTGPVQFTIGSPQPAPAAQAPQPAPTTQAPQPAPTTQAPQPAPTTQAPQPAPTTQVPQPAPTTAPAQPTPVTAYNNYGPANEPGHPVCRDNPGRPESVPGGQVTQTFTVPSGVAYLNTATVQIDNDPGISNTIVVTLTINDGSNSVQSTAYANGDTTFNFSNLNVGAGDNITMTLNFSASYGKITTVYDAGSPGGQMTVMNSCSDGAANWTSSGSGLRATVSGMSA